MENLTVRSSTPTLVQDLYTLTSKGARAPFIVGTPASVAEELIDWVDKTGIDGFNIARLSVPNTLLSIVDLLVPELQNRGYFKTGYSEGTLRKNSKEEVLHSYSRLILRQKFSVQFKNYIMTINDSPSYVIEEKLYPGSSLIMS